MIRFCEGVALPSVILTVLIQACVDVFADALMDPPCRRHVILCLFCAPCQVHDPCVCAIALKKINHRVKRKLTLKIMFEIYA